MSFVVLTILSISDDYKRSESNVTHQDIFANKELAKRGLIVWMLNNINEEEIRIVNNMRLQSYVRAEVYLDSVDIMTSIDNNPYHTPSVRVDLLIEDLLSCYEGEFVDSKIDYEITEHKMGEIVDSIAKVDALLDTTYKDDIADAEDDEEEENDEEDMEDAQNDMENDQE